MQINLVPDLLFLVTMISKVTSQYNCSTRPDGDCTPCDCKPDCFDLSDEVNCTGKMDIHDVLQPRNMMVKVQTETGKDMQFFSPPPLPPFSLCPDKQTTTQQPTTRHQTTIQQSSTTHQITSQQPTTEHQSTTQRSSTTASLPTQPRTTANSPTQPRTTANLPTQPRTTANLPTQPRTTSYLTTRVTTTVLQPTTRTVLPPQTSTTTKYTTSVTTVTPPQPTTAQPLQTTTIRQSTMPVSNKTTKTQKIVPTTQVTQPTTSTKKETARPTTSRPTTKPSGAISRWFCGVVSQQYYRRCRSIVYRFNEYCNYMVKVLQLCRRINVPTTRKPTTTTTIPPPTFPTTIFPDYSYDYFNNEMGFDYLLG